MRTLKTLAAALVLPLVFALPAVAADKEAPAETTKKPSLTYYYFDG